MTRIGDLGGLMRSTRKEELRTIESLAGILKIGVLTVGAWEKGDSLPSENHWKPLALAYKIPWPEFLRVAAAEKELRATAKGIRSTRSTKRKSNPEDYGLPSSGPITGRARGKDAGQLS